MASAFIHQEESYCFCCLGPYFGRVVKFKSRKWKQEEVDVKLSKIFACDDQIPKFINERRLSLCLSCMKKLTACADVIDLMRTSIAKLQHNRKRPLTTAMHTSTSHEKQDECDHLRDPIKSVLHEIDSNIERTPVGPGSVNGNECTETHDSKASDSIHGLRRALFEKDTSSTVKSCKENSSVDHTYQRDHKHEHSYTKKTTLPETECDKNILASTGIRGNKLYSCNHLDPQVQELDKIIHTHDPCKIAAAVMKIPSMNASIRGSILQQIDSECTSLCRIKIKPSVMRTNKTSGNLMDGELFTDIIDEMNTRCPFMLDILSTVSSGPGQKLNSPHKAPLATVFAMLMNLRNPQLSAVQRYITTLAVRGHADDMFLTRLNKLNVTLSTTRKLSLLEECGLQSHQAVVNRLQENKYPKIIGDNLDIYIRTGRQTMESQHRDMHMFTSIITFSRVPRVLDALLNEKPKNVIANLDTNKIVVMETSQLNSLLNGYMVILGRLFASHFKAFKWLEPLLPKHIPHRFSSEMSQKSCVHSLPLLFKNEAKYEDCVDILQSYENELHKMYTEAHGSPKNLHMIPVGGDQLTHVRFEVAKDMRLLSSVPSHKFSHLGPMIGEMWHNKRDLLEKAYKKFYSSSQQKERCTLYYFKTLLHRSDANGNVKSNYSAHADLFKDVGVEFLLSQAMIYFTMEDEDSIPTNDVFPSDVSSQPVEQQAKIAERMLLNYLSHHSYGKFCLEKVEDPVKQVYEFIGATSDGKFLIKAVDQSDDQLFNYCTQFCHWALHFMELEDTAKEGDVDRLLANCQYNIPFFYSHSKLSKYLCENIDFVLKTKYTQSPRTSLRLLEGSFINKHGGIGCNVEADLVQEHSVRTRKELIRALGANKTEKAMVRATGASDAVQCVTSSFDIQTDIKRKSGRHTKRSSESDKNRIRQVCADAMPFKNTPGRTIKGKPLKGSPFATIDTSEMMKDISRIVRRLTLGEVNVAPENQGESGSQSDSDGELPPL